MSSTDRIARRRNLSETTAFGAVLRLNRRLRRRLGKWHGWVIGVLLLSAIGGPVACHASVGDADGSAWDRARAALVAQTQGPMAQAIARWRDLTASEQFGFTDYSSFVLAYPGFPDEDRLRRSAEGALSRETIGPSTVVAYFDRKPPLTNPGRAAYALALRAMGRPEATEVARAAWRGGSMSDYAESAIFALWGTNFTAADQDARIDALLWNADTAAANRQLPRATPRQQTIATARLAILRGVDPYAAAPGVSAQLLDSDPGFVWQRARQFRHQGDARAAALYLASRPLLEKKPFDRARWIAELLTEARAAAGLGDSTSAWRIAAGAGDAFDPGEDLSQMPFAPRDDYTSLMWLGGTTALWSLGNPAAAAPLFRDFGAAARTPGTRSKGYYWAGLASLRAGQTIDAARDFQVAARHPDQFYGQLAIERTGLAMPQFAGDVQAQPTPEERARFASAPLTGAVMEVARNGDWRTTIRFFKAIAEQQQTESQHLLVADLARSLGRRDLGVIVGQAAEEHGLYDFQRIAFPLIPVPADEARSWTMIHAIIRQESQFAENAISHAGARGLMQMMPRTAGEQAGRLGLGYNADALIADPQFNIAVGGAYFSRLMTMFNGSYPLAVAAYNAGGGNVNKWLRAYGDPRTGTISWVDWIERIPLSETRAYVEHVLENAVVYEAMYPDRATYKGPAPLSHFLGKPTPG